MDGISRPEDMILKAKEKGLKSIALTDHGHMHGIADFHFAGKKHDVKTIFGTEAYIIDDLENWRKEKEKLESDKEMLKLLKNEESVDEDATNLSVENRKKMLYRKGHLVLLAQNQRGLENIYKLTHLAHKFGMYMKPRMDKKMLNDHSEGVIASSACMGGVISNRCWSFKNGHSEWSDVVREAEEFRDIFGERFFLELQFNESDSQRFINDCIIKVHKETGIPLDVTADAHYIDYDDWRAQEVLYMLRSNKTVETVGDDWNFEIKQLFIKSPHEMWDAYERYGGEADASLVRQAFENTLLIDSMIEDFDPDTHERLPTCRFENPFKKLGEVSIQRMKELHLDDDERYRKRFLHEMTLIKEKGFAAYFLIMRDIISKAKEKMLVGPGRGSAAGSLICYLAGLTNLDPIKHGLMFERFINPSRLELPDIDTDFQDSDQARQMLRDMFGEDNVACISTYGTFQIKGLLKDVTRVYGLDHKEVNKMNRKIEAELKALKGKGQDKNTIDIKYEDVLRVSNTYRELIDKHPDVGVAVEKLYGRNRHVGRHACGLVIGDDLPNEMAVFYNKGILQTSFTDGIVNKQCSAMGFVKFDILSLSTLSVIDKTLKLMCERHSMSYEDAYRMVDPTYMDASDPKVIKTVFLDGNFTGIFQFTNKGIQKVAKMIKPDCFEDVSAVGALYRPGPLGGGMHKLYAERKHDPKKISYIHPIVEDILKETYGCLVYQEQMLEIGHKLGKLPMTHVNRLRKLFLKRNKESNQKFDEEKKTLHDMFVSGCVENGLAEKEANALWDDFAKWGSYGFNASHAKCYGMISMQTAFLRTYYPIEFFAALLMHGQADDLQSYVDDIKKQGFKILPVDVNKSGESHALEGDAIRLALTSVLGVGAAAARKIAAHQPFESFLDYLDRTGGGKTATAPLIKVGAFSSVEDNSARLEGLFDIWIGNPKLKQKRNREELLRRFEEVHLSEHPIERLIEFENELLGFNLRGSPFELFERPKKISVLESEGLIDDYEEFVSSDREIGLIPVIVKEYTQKAQSKGGMMAFMRFADRTGTEFQAPAFAQVWRHIGVKTVKGNVYLLTVNRRLEEPMNLVVGKPGWKHSPSAASDYLVNIDEL